MFNNSSNANEPTNSKTNKSPLNSDGQQLTNQQSPLNSDNQQFL